MLLVGYPYSLRLLFLLQLLFAVLVTDRSGAQTKGLDTSGGFDRLNLADTHNTETHPLSDLETRQPATVLASTQLQNDDNIADVEGNTGRHATVTTRSSEQKDATDRVGQTDTERRARRDRTSTRRLDSNSTHRRASFARGGSGSSDRNPSGASSSLNGQQDPSMNRTRSESFTLATSEELDWNFSLPRLYFSAPSFLNFSNPVTTRITDWFRRPTTTTTAGFIPTETQTTATLDAIQPEDHFLIPDISDMRCLPGGLFHDCVQLCFDESNHYEQQQSTSLLLFVGEKGPALESAAIQGLARCVSDCRSEYIETKIPGCVTSSGKILPGAPISNLDGKVYPDSIRKPGTFSYYFSRRIHRFFEDQFLEQSLVLLLTAVAFSGLVVLVVHQSDAIATQCPAVERLIERTGLHRVFNWVMQKTHAVAALGLRPSRSDEGQEGHAAAESSLLGEET